MQKLEIEKSFPESDTAMDLSIKINKKDILEKLKTHIQIEDFIPPEFYRAFYKDKGRTRGVKLESFMWCLILQSVIGLACDSTFLSIVEMCRELREFCGFDRVPDAGKVTTFKQTFVEYIVLVFEKFVEATEPICEKLDPKKSAYLIYDPTGIEAHVKENNPKFVNSKINQAKKFAAKNPEINAHALAYSTMPDAAEANPFVKQQYINGHFCYAHKAGVITNGLGIVRHISFFDEPFKLKYPEVVSQKTDDPTKDKEIADSTSLKPVLNDFFQAHPHFFGKYHTFLGDASFDVYDIYSMLRHDFQFQRICIPINPRNSDNKHQHFDANGTPLCPVDDTPFVYDGVCRGENRSERIKFLCPKSVRPKGSSKPICRCEHPCTDNSYKCTYVYPHADLRLYPGITRGTEHWDNLYRHRTIAERTIYLLKEPLAGANRKSFSERTAKANLFIAGIAHLIGVIIAVATNNNKLFKSIRKIIAA
jgi:hypothetical protein